MEEWRDIEGYEGVYQVSSQGRVKSLKNGRWGTGKEKILKAGKDKHGYLIVWLYKDGKPTGYLVHRLVASAFIPNSLNLQEINHRDENKSNNAVSNLEWCDRFYNIRYGTGIKRRSIAQGVKIRCIETNKIFNSSYEVQRELGFNQGNIIQCCKGRLKTCGKLHWEYAS